MKITIVSLNFYPEDTAIGLYSSQMAEFLSEKHDVEVVTGFPYYPQWKIPKNYSHKPKTFSEKWKNIKIYRFKQIIPKKVNFKGRLLLMLSFTFGLFINFFKVKKPDIIICVVPFTSSILFGILGKVFYGSKVWVHIQDFEFEAAIESGLINNNQMKGALLGLEKFLFNRADGLSTISHQMMNKLKEKTHQPTALIPNWIEINQPIFDKKHPYFEGFSNTFNILYSGNIGEKQDWDFFVKLVKAAEKEEFNFIVVGDGATKQKLVARTADFKNVHHFPPVPLEELNQLLFSADAHILIQKNTVKDTVMPSKILGMMNSGKPSIVLGNPESEIKSTFQKTNDFYFENYNTQRVIDCLVELNQQKDDVTKYQSSREYVQSHFEKTQILKHLENHLLKL